MWPRKEGCPERPAEPGTAPRGAWRSCRALPRPPTQPQTAPLAGPPARKSPAAPDKVYLIAHVPPRRVPGGARGRGRWHSVFAKEGWSHHHLLSSPVNGSKTGRTLVENFSPNQTRFTLQRTDPISRYRFFLRARTQVGEGEAIVEESPALLNEGMCSSNSFWLCCGVKGVTVHVSAKICRWSTEQPVTGAQQRQIVDEDQILQQKCC